MDWRPAPSVKLGLTEANQRWPSRNTASDGMLGDAAHQARPSSDHNPDERGVVHAFDLTHDPDAGVDCAVLSARIVDRKDLRLRYVIWNRRIALGPWSDSVMDGRSQPWQWKAYTGPNPHDHHMHVSVGYSATAENDILHPWYGPAEPEDDMYDTKAEQRLFARIEAAERRTARYVDHGDAERTGSDDHHEAIRADLAKLAAQVTEVTRLVEGLVLKGGDPTA